ncbi:hypothetical protein Vadar_004450 [Vaccinium darrowii]|uniref:Uncharacterized protein n=1 Tax=Vaccinium darrowii TaxID=229202 RepID=A0ACB7XN62_9ERIC|nr:hypothetical protein Vadar_004450 [Vaccinium darrowii]
MEFLELVHVHTLHSDGCKLHCNCIRRRHRELRWGLGICVAANVVGLVVFVVGTQFYRHVKPKGSPFTGFARVVVAAVRKRNVVVSKKSEDYYHRADYGEVNLVAATPTDTFK